MARKRSPALTDGEARIMSVLWERPQASVSKVVAALQRRHPVTYSTAQTMLRILEQKGYVTHEKVGRAFVYRPLVDQRHARRLALRHLIRRLFEGSPSLLVRNVLEDDEIDPAERRRLKHLIAKA